MHIASPWRLWSFRSWSAHVQCIIDNVGCQSDGTHIQAEPLGFGAWQPSQPLGLYAGTCIESRGTFFFGLRVDIRPRPFNDSVKRPSDVSGFATALAKIVL
jgi:hypothetical protein